MKSRHGLSMTAVCSLPGMRSLVLVFQTKELLRTDLLCNYPHERRKARNSGCVGLVRRAPWATRASPAALVPPPRCFLLLFFLLHRFPPPLSSSSLLSSSCCFLLFTTALAAAALRVFPRLYDGRRPVLISSWHCGQYRSSSSGGKSFNGTFAAKW